jgi:biotin carboxyl carrier protein
MLMDRQAEQAAFAKACAYLNYKKGAKWTAHAAAAGTGVWPRHADAHQGERLTGADRVVVSPAAGVFRGVPALGTAPGPGALAQPSPANPTVGVGELLGHVGAAEVRSPFAGIVVGWLVHPDERVAAGQPVAWLRTADDPTAPAPSKRTDR